MPMPKHQRRQWLVKQDARLELLTCPDRGGITSLRHTRAAHVAIIYAAVPLIADGIGFTFSHIVASLNSRTPVAAET